MFALTSRQVNDLIYKMIISPLIYPDVIQVVAGSHGIEVCFTPVNVELRTGSPPPC